MTDYILIELGRKELGTEYRIKKRIASLIRKDEDLQDVVEDIKIMRLV